MINLNHKTKISNYKSDIWYGVTLVHMTEPINDNVWLLFLFRFLIESKQLLVKCMSCEKYSKSYFLLSQIQRLLIINFINFHDL